MRNYTWTDDGKCYKYNTRIGNTFFCPGNIIIKGGKAQKIEKQGKRFLIDYFVVDTEQKTIQIADDRIKDSFTDSLTDIQKVEITNDRNSKDGRKNVMLYKEGQDEPIVIAVDKGNKIVGYKNSELTEVGDNFLRYATGLEVLEVPKLEKTGECFCYYNSLKELEVPKLKNAGDDFCNNSPCLRKINAPELIETGEDMLESAGSLEEFYAPKLEKVGGYFCNINSYISIDFPKLKKIGHTFCYHSRRVKSIHLPQAECVGDDFMSAAPAVTHVDMENLRKAGTSFLASSTDIKEFNVPKISRLQWFFSPNKHIASIISNIKKHKERRINKRDIAVLDKESGLITKEVEEASTTIEGKNIDNVKEVEDGR